MTLPDTLVVWRPVPTADTIKPDCTNPTLYLIVSGWYYQVLPGIPDQPAVCLIRERHEFTLFWFTAALERVTKRFYQTFCWKLLLAIKQTSSKLLVAVKSSNYLFFLLEHLRTDQSESWSFNLISVQSLQTEKSEPYHRGGKIIEAS